MPNYDIVDGSVPVVVVSQTGTRGAQGPTGIQGVQGGNGAQGVAGAQGVQGGAGVQGATGATGLQGTTGSQGVQGFNGTQGTTGAQGAIGSQGLQGTVGAQGNTGIQGATGTQGLLGTQGIQGTIGDTGIQGAQGNLGIQGVRGPQGTTGATGLQGTQGFSIQGPAGTAVTILGSYPSYAALIAAHPTGNVGDGYLVNGDLYVWSDDTNSWVNVGNIQGPQGLAGVQGSVGLQGTQGVQGTIGSQGLTGIQGDLGLQGSIGAQGTVGAQGATGTQGLVGIQGATGEQGIQGLQGFDGAQGIQGTIGAQGIQGTVGIQGGVGRGYNVTSTTNIPAGIGTRQFLTSSTGAYVVGDYVGMFDNTNNIKLYGFITFVEVDVRFQVTVDKVVGSGTGNNWVATLFGVQGTTGTQGANGLQGTQGIQGFQGIVGETGIITGPTPPTETDVLWADTTSSSSSIQGATGAQGAVGLQGVQGAQGITGAQGLTGIQGETGTQGVQGVQGAQGTIGSQGLTGTQGATGSQGTDGLQGVQGATGAQGAQGIQGNLGIQGTQGIQGVIGLQGIQGTTGIQGTDGLQGTQGVQGVQGGSGSLYNTSTNSSITFTNLNTGTLTVGTGLAYQQGMTLLLYKSATIYATARILEYTGSALSVQLVSVTGSGVQSGFQISLFGAQGLTGTQGIQGIQGIQGAYYYSTSTSANTIGVGTLTFNTSNTSSFAVGNTVNVIGLQSGVVQATGIGTITSLTSNSIMQVAVARVTSGTGSFTEWQITLNGAIGIQGAQGIQGVQGTEGLQGVQGLQGAQGIQGVQGLQGVQSTQGIQGVQGLQGAIPSAPLTLTATTNNANYPLTIASNNQQGGGAGYADITKWTSTVSGATNTHKNWRMSNTGQLEIVNSAYNAVIMYLSDSGNFGVSGTINNSNIYDTGWSQITSFGSGWTAGQDVYSRVINGVVYLRGGVYQGTAGTQAFTLPVGHRPTVDAVIAVPQLGASTVNWVTIGTNGAVIPNGTGAWLSGVSFPSN